MSVPISALVQVLPGTIVAAGNAVDILGLFITDSAKIPGGAVKSYSSITDVAKDFEATEKEYKAAQVYFNSYTNSTQKPAHILFAYQSTQETAAFLTGGNLGDMTVDDLKEFSGDLTITVSREELTNASIVFTDITTFADAADVIQNALDSTKEKIAVNFDAARKDFVITTVAKGKAATITVATGSLASQIMLDSASATVSQGASPKSPAELMNSILDINRNWATFTTLYKSSIEEKVAYSAWASSKNNRFCYIDREMPDESKEDWSSTWYGLVQKNQYSGIVGVYEENSDSPLYPAFIMGCAASFDFNRLNGRTTFAYRTQAGLAPTDMDQSLYNRLTDFGYNVYANFAGTKENFNFIQKGKVSGQFLWLDTFINQIWLNANLQLRSIYVLKDNPLLPYNRIGYSKFIVSWSAQADLAVNYGAIQTGVNLDPSQLQQVESAVGFDVSDSLASKGYYIDIKDAPASVRIERGSPPSTFYYVDGGSIQSITLASIAIL